MASTCKTSIHQTTSACKNKAKPYQSHIPRDFEILSWCPAGTFLPHLALVGHPSSDGIMIKMPYGVDDMPRGFKTKCRMNESN